MSNKGVSKSMRRKGERKKENERDLRVYKFFFFYLTTKSILEN